MAAWASHTTQTLSALSGTLLNALTVLVGGRVLMEGGVDEVQRDERVRAVYLGRERHV